MIYYKNVPLNMTVTRKNEQENEPERCPACKGSGIRREAIGLDLELWEPCPDCAGCGKKADGKKNGDKKD